MGLGAKILFSWLAVPWLTQVGDGYFNSGELHIPIASGSGHTSVTDLNYG